MEEKVNIAGGGELIKMNDSFIQQEKRRRELIRNIALRLDLIKLRKNPSPNGLDFPSTGATISDRPFNFMEEMAARYKEIGYDNDQLQDIFERLCDLV